MQRVRNTKTGEEGFVVRDSFNCCTEDELAIVYDGETSFLGTDKSLLVDIDYEIPIPDLKKCGAGQGKECCIFLTMTADGPECQRFTSMRDSLIFKTMTAERDPSEPYPECMKF